MYIHSLDIEDFRCFRSASLEFYYPGKSTNAKPAFPNMNLLLGNNGMGKTTVLKAAAMAALSPIIESVGYRPYSIVRRAGTGDIHQAAVRARVRLHPQDFKGAATNELQRLETVIRKKGDLESIDAPSRDEPHWQGMYQDSSPAFLLVGYGATRRVESAETFDSSARLKSRHIRYQRVAGLFEDHISLIPLTAWLPRMASENPGRHKQVVNLINRLLPEETRFPGRLEGGDYLFRHRRLDVALGALSDGFRAYIGWICDLLYHICMGAPSGAKLVENRGVVLIDEVDLHLHPEWQRFVLPTISRVLPNLQFICTTHSPIVAGTLRSANVFPIIDNGKSASGIGEVREEIHGLNADQILLTPTFGLTSTRAPAFVEKLRQVSRRAERGDEKASLQFARMIAEGAGAERGQPPEAAPPAWVKVAARKRTGAAKRSPKLSAAGGKKRPATKRKARPGGAGRPKKK